MDGKSWIEKKLISLLVSRRFLLLVAGIVVLVAKEFGGYELDTEVVMGAIILIGTWILGDSWRPTELPKPVLLLAASTAAVCSLCSLAA